MKKRNGKKTRSMPPKRNIFQESLAMYSALEELKKEFLSLKEAGSKNEDRLADIEIHLNLLTRLLTTLCIEKFGIRAGALKSLVRRIEKEAMRDSQIMELESLYHLSPGTGKKTSSPTPKTKVDPWDQIS